MIEERFRVAIRAVITRASEECQLCHSTPEKCDYRGNSARLLTILGDSLREKDIELSFIALFQVLLHDF